MKNKLNISTVVLALFGFIAVQTSTAQAPNPAKAEAKTTEPKFVYFKGSFTKFHPGKREEAINLIYNRFWTVDQVVGRKPIPFELLTGEWDHMGFFRLHGGLAEMELKKAAMQAKWDRQLEKQEGGPEKAKALHDYHDSLVMKRGGGLFKVPAADVDFSDYYYNKGGKPTYYRVNFVKYKSGKKEQAIDFLLGKYRPVRLAIDRAVIPMVSIAGGWDRIVFISLPGGLGDLESDSLSEAWQEELAKQQGGREKAAEVRNYYNGLVQDRVTEIAEGRWKK